MIRAVSSEISKQHRDMRKPTKSGYVQWRTSFIGKRIAQVEDSPQAFLSEAPPVTFPPYYHQVDQFQVMVAGGGTLGRKNIPALAVQYADQHKAYEAVVSGPVGMEIFTSVAP